MRVIVYLCFTTTQLLLLLLLSTASATTIGPYLSAQAWGRYTSHRSTNNYPESCSSDRKVIQNALIRPNLDESLYETMPASVTTAPASAMGRNLLRGALLRIASDVLGGTAMESVKTRVTTTAENSIQAARGIISAQGIGGLWAGTPSRTIEGFFMGGMFLWASTGTKVYMKQFGASKTMTALAAGLVGGVVQSVVMTPSGMIFTSLNVNRGKPGFENDNALSVCKRVINEKGVLGMYTGLGAMAFRQASNWASRSFFTELARTSFQLSSYGMMGEIASGVAGGLCSCWNTPIETIRVFMQRDVAMGNEAKSFPEYWNDIVDANGVPGLFRGVTPRSIQAIWQTCFMVVVPNVLGV